MKFTIYDQKEGDTRIKKNKFLFFPRLLPTEDSKTEEFKWLEKASWEEVYSFKCKDNIGHHICSWVPSKWIKE